MEALAHAGKGAQGAEFERDEAPLVRGFESFSRSFDEEYGGFGGAPKFPRPSVLNFLLRFATRATGDRANRAATWRSSRYVRWQLAGCAIILAEAFTDIRSTNIGTSHISRRCSTIRRSSLFPSSRRGN